MSKHKKDRERASKGLVFRGGKLVPKDTEPEEASPEEAAGIISSIHTTTNKIIAVKILDHQVTNE